MEKSPLSSTAAQAGGKSTSPSHERVSFFKYYTAVAAIKTLESGARKWSTPALFNDPFDNQFDLSFEEPTQELAEQNYDLFEKMLRSPDPIGPNQFYAHAEELELIRQALAANPDLEFSKEERAYVVEGVLEGMRNVTNMAPQTSAEIRRVLADTSIFCVSETHDNLLMWSHHAHDHTGAVIEFLSLAEVDSPLILAQPVRYAKDMPRMTFVSLLDFERSKREVLDTITLSKSDAWSYEKEWRVIGSLRDRSKTFEILAYAPEEVRAVYLGCKISERDQENIISVTRKKYPKACLLKAEKHPTKFALEFRGI